VFEALAHPVRRRILKILRKRPHTAGEIADEFDLPSRRCPAISLGAIALLVVTQMVIVVYARGTRFDIGEIVIAAVAVLLVAMGNFLGKTRPNFFAGVRTPWSLSNDLARKKSNRAAGRLFVLTGLATLGALLIAGVLTALAALLVGLTGAAAISIVLSYVYWRRDPRRHALDITRE
jgi:uncharacterized membrane protein